MSEFITDGVISAKNRGLFKIQYYYRSKFHVNFIQEGLLVKNKKRKKEKVWEYYKRV